jgi:hypothetical protein
MTMPNYVMNRLKLKGSPEKNKEVMAYIRSEDGTMQIDFNKIVPVPAHVYQGNLGSEEEKLFGNNTWYEWCIEHWGTKWNAICEDEDKQKCTGDTIYFQTAWSGVLKLIYHLSAKFREVCFIYEFSDEDFGYNCESHVLKHDFEPNAHEKPEGGSKEAFELAQSLWQREDYYFDSFKNKICNKEWDEEG